MSSHRMRGLILWGGHGMFGAFDINTMCPVLGQGMMSALVLWSLWDTIG